MTDLFGNEVEEHENVHFSSKSVEWATPQDVFDGLNREFGFGTDVCATPENAKCSVFFTKEDDGLSRKWTGVCWRNPPYGREMPKWIQKAYESSLSLVRPWFSSYRPGPTQRLGTTTA